MLNLLKKFYKDESGATMVEYAIMVALIAVAVAAVVILLSNEMNSLFNSVTACLASPSTDSCTIQ
jgi:pilus assembly protein Flp/PilA